MKDIISRLCTYLAIMLISVNLFGIPAKPGIITLKQPDGSLLNVYLYGDENSHYYTSSDKYLLLKDEQEFFRYAVLSDEEKVIAGEAIAHNIEARSASEKEYLAQINKEEIYRFFGAERIMLQAKAKYKGKLEEEETTFPTSGEQKGVVILVEFSNKAFTVANPQQAFDDLLNKEGYDANGATGSARDYYMVNSMGKFRPHFDVYGPVKLSKPYSYYGQNDKYGNDMYAPEMVAEACSLLDDKIDFTEYDRDDNGFIDNVYIFYAGYGEADGGEEKTIWPHSWDVFLGAEKTFFFDGKQLGHYACSNELMNGSGETMTGISTFCHEFIHVLGFPDLYATNYNPAAFTPGTWSIMDQGSYNNECRTPPYMSLYERYCMGWVEPKELSKPSNILLRNIAENDGYIIRTESEDEYYLLENRQQKDWDVYLPGHGMLIWHIDYDKELWDLNQVNVDNYHQHVDIVEADNDPAYYSATGDPFPGESNITEFTDETKPSMKSWGGKALFSPVTDIKEQNEVISFLFKGGVDAFDPVVAKDATEILPGGFTLHWETERHATGYCVNVYTKTIGRDGKEIKVYVEGYQRKEVGNVTSCKVTGLVPLTTYYYTICATDGIFSSAESNEIIVVTDEPTLDYLKVVVKEPTELTPTSFVANWELLEGADTYTLSVYTTRLGEPYPASLDFTGGLEALPEGWVTSCTGTYGLSGFCGQATPSLKMDKDEDYLQTPIFNDQIRTLSFWYRGNNASEKNSLLIMGYKNNRWDQLSAVSPLINETGGENVSMEIPEGYIAVKFIFHKPESGNLALDDIIVGHGGDMVELPLDNYKEINVGLCASYAVTGIEERIKCSYTVTAHNEQFTSLLSDKMYVDLSNASSNMVETKSDMVCCWTQKGSILVKLPASQRITVYDSMGNKITEKEGSVGLNSFKLATGHLYLVVTGGNTYKVIL